MKKILFLTFLSLSALLHAQQYELVDTVSQPKLQFINDLNSKDRTLNFVDEGISFWIPQDYVYSIYARELIEKKDGDIEVYRDVEDKNSLFFIAKFQGAKGDFTYRSQFKDIEGEDKNDFWKLGNLSHQFSLYTDDKIVKETVLIIDGIECKAIFYGVPYDTNLHLCFENEEAYFSMNIERINKNSIAFFDKLLSSVKIKSSQKRVKYNTQKPLSSVLALEDRPAITLDKLDIPKVSSLDLQSFRCVLPKVGISVYLPGIVSDYTYAVNTDWRTDSLILGANDSFDLVPTYDTFRVSIGNSASLHTVEMTLYLNYGKAFSTKEETEDMFQFWNTISSNRGQFNDYKSAGILTANDGSQWGVLFKNFSNNAIVLGGNDRYSIFYDINANSQEELMDILSLIYQFKLDE